MKKLLFQIVLMLVFSPSMAMVVFMNHAVFRNDDSGSIIEIYLKIPLSSLYFGKTEDDKFQASVNYEIKILKNDSLMFYRVYNLLSPLLSDTENLNFALLDLKRIELPMNLYHLEIQLYDNFYTGNRASASTLVNARFSQTTVSFSDIELLDTFYTSTSQPGKFSRSGRELIPNVFNSFTFEQNSVYFYSELYNTSRLINEKTLFFKYYLLKDSIMVENSEKISRQNAGIVNFLLGSIHIAFLPEGNYELKIEAYSSANQKLAEKSIVFSKRRSHEYFIRLSSESSQIRFAKMLKEFSLDELKKNVSYLEIIADNREIQQIRLLKKETDRAELENFLYGFWMKRDSIDPGKSWLEYYNRVNDCNRQFTTMLREGYLTDRGRVYLEYGPPNSISESSSSQLAYPYQIWHYYQLTKGQQNKKFVFFNRTGALNEYELIHSNAIGEPQNPRWREIISKYNNLNETNSKFFGDFLDKDFDE